MQGIFLFILKQKIFDTAILNVSKPSQTPNDFCIKKYSSGKFAVNEKMNNLQAKVSRT